MCEILEDKGYPVPGDSCVLTFIWRRLDLCQMRRYARSHAVLLIPVPCSSLVRMPSIFSSAGGKRHPEKENLPSLPSQEVPSWIGQLQYPEPWLCLHTEAFLSGPLPQWYHFTSKKAQCPWASWPHCEDPVSLSCLKHVLLWCYLFPLSTKKEWMWTLKSDRSKSCPVPRYLCDFTALCRNCSLNSSFRGKLMWNKF